MRPELTEFLWFWIMLAVMITVVVLAWTLRDWLVSKSPWYFSATDRTAILLTPWGGFEVDHDTPLYNRRRVVKSGITIFGPLSQVREGEELPIVYEYMKYYNC